MAPSRFPNKSFCLFGSFIRRYLFYGSHDLLRSLCQDKMNVKISNRQIASGLLRIPRKARDEGSIRMTLN